MLFRWLAIILATVLILGAGMLFAVNLILLPRLDSMLADAMRRELSLPDDARVEIQRGTLRQTFRGFLPASETESPAAILDDIPVEYLLFETTDIDFNMRRIIQGEKAQITSIGSAELRLRISTDELESRLIKQIGRQGMQEVEVEFGEGTVQVSGINKAGTRMSASGQFYLMDKHQVGFALTDMELDMLNIRVRDLALPLDDVLPPLDLGGMFALVWIDNLMVSEDYLEIRAHARGMETGEMPERSIEVF